MRASRKDGAPPQSHWLRHQEAHSILQFATKRSMGKKVHTPILGDGISEFGTKLSLHREQWRYTGPFTRLNRFRGTFPGFGTAAVAFAVYCGYEYLFLKDEHHEHAEGGHSKGH
ncbi:MAG: hypothetical protein Q9191_004816 [Dirinaria sp. TL-2023a]